MMQRRSTWQFLGACAITFWTATFVSAQDHEVLRGRLVFSDHEKAVVRVLDLDSGKVTHTFPVPKARPSLAASHDGRYVVIPIGDDKGTVRVLDTGLVLEAHGDHQDVEKGAVRLLKTTVTGERPAHVLSGHGWTSVFFDGPRPADRLSGARAVLLDHKRLARNGNIVLTWNSISPQHGMAVPLGQNLWVMTNPNGAYAKQEPNASSLPTGVQIVDASRRWERIAAFDNICPEMHGHGARGGSHVFGCKERSADDPRSGSLLVLGTDARGQWTSRALVYPDDRRVSTLKSGGDGGVVVGNYGRGRRYDALIKIDATSSGLVSADVFAVPDNQAACQFEVTSDGRRVVNLLADGSLRLYDMSPAWKEVARFEAVPAFDCAFGAATPRPALGIGGDTVFVSDPVTRRIREFRVDGMKLKRDLRVDGKPEKLAVGRFAH
jgi:hypothetical protein